MRKLLIIFLLIIEVNNIRAEIIPCLYPSENIPVYTLDSVCTPNNSFIKVHYLQAGDLTTQEKTDFDSCCQNYYNHQIAFIDSATRAYNCHGYAWSVSENQDTVWINQTEDPFKNLAYYWEDGSYDEAATVSDANKVFNEYGDHSMVTTASPDTFISKWGYLPLYKHHYKDCPDSYHVKYMNGSDSIYIQYFFRCNTNRISIEGFNNIDTTITGCKIELDSIEIYNSNIIFDAIEGIEINSEFYMDSNSTLELK